MVLRAAPITLLGKVVNSCTFGSIVGLGKRTCPRSRGASGHSKEAAHLQTQMVPGASSFGRSKRPSSVKGSKHSQPGEPDFATSPSGKIMSLLMTCIPSSEPSSAAQHGLTTIDAYAETTFPFKISAGAMTFISPLPTMDTAKIEVRLPTVRHGTAKPTCLATAHEKVATAPAPLPLSLPAPGRKCACAVREAFLPRRAEG